MKKVLAVLAALLMVIVLVIIGCSKKKDITLTAADFGTATATVAVGTATVTKTNTPAYSPTITPTFTVTVFPTYPPGWIDSCEDGGNTGTGNVCDFHGDHPAPNVGGYWITYDDDDWSNPYTGAGLVNCTNPNNTVYSNCGTSYVWPESQTWATRKGLPAPGPFTMSSPGYPSSPYNGQFGGSYAAKMTGYVTTNVSTLPPGETQYGFQYGFIGMGVQLTCTAGATNTFGLPTCQKVDVSGYTGYKFWAKSTSNGGAGSAFETKLPYTPSTGNCDDPITGTLDGFNDYAFQFTATGTWTLITVPFAQLAQASGWGVTVSKTTVLQNVSQIQWQSGDQSAGYTYGTGAVDLEIDDITFYY